MSRAANHSQVVKLRFGNDLLKIGTAGFEPTTSCTPSTSRLCRESINYAEISTYDFHRFHSFHGFGPFPEFLGTVWGQVRQLVCRLPVGQDSNAEGTAAGGTIALARSNSRAFSKQDVPGPK